MQPSALNFKFNRTDCVQKYKTEITGSCVTVRSEPGACVFIYENCLFWNEWIPIVVRKVFFGVQS